MTTQTEILQWNVNSYFQRLPFIQIIQKKYNPKILCFQEINLKKDQKITIKGYQTYIKSREHASGGVLVAVKKEYHSEEIPLNTNLEAIAVRINSPKKITICNLYLPQSQKAEEDNLNQLIAQLPKPFFLLGDFNSHNPLWGSTRTDKRGKTVEHVMNNTDLNIINTGEHTHLNPTSRTFSCIDLTLCSSNICQNYSWKTLEELYDSDHFPIIIDKISSKQDNIQPLERWKINDKTNWSLYQEEIEEKLQQAMEIIQDGNIDTTLEKFENILINSAKKHIGITIPPKRNLVPWWNKECSVAIKNKKKAYNKFKKKPTQNNYIEFQKHKAISRRTIRNSKRNSWSKFLNEINSKTTSKDLWRKIRSIKGINTSFTITSLEESDELITDTRQIAEKIASTFEKNSNSENYDTEYLQQNQLRLIRIKEKITTEHDNWENYNTTFTTGELKNVIANSKNTAAGPDKIPNIFLKKLPEIAIETLLGIYNRIWTEEVFPEKWRYAIVVPILKPGKVQTKTDSYRPISLTCTMCKMMEKMINNRLLWKIEKNCIISDNQNGFRRNRNTMDNIMKIQTEICNTLARKNSLIIASLDIQKAYDMTDRSLILEALQTIPINGRLFAFCQNFLEKRYFQVRLNNTTSSIKTQENGVPQGSVLSVTFFLLAINSITKTVDQGTTCLQFADDIILLSQHSTAENAKLSIQKTLDNMVHWQKTTGYKFSTDKCKAMVCTRKYKELNNTVNLLLGESPLQIVNEIKILGMTFDRKLNWKSHINRLKQECQSKIKLLKIIAHSEWGADRDTVLRIYKSTILSKIDYGSIAYHSAKKSVLKTLDTIHRTGIKIAISAFHTSPTITILLDAEETELRYRREMLLMRYAASKPTRSNILFYIQNQEYIKTFEMQPSTPKSGPYMIHQLCRKYELTLRNIKKFKQNTFPPWLVTNVNTNTKFLQTDKKKDPIQTRDFFHMLTDTEFNDFEHIYVDASKNKSGVGFAVVHRKIKISRKLPPITSIYHAELMAIKTAYTYAINEHQIHKIVIFSDSLSSITSLMNKTSRDELITEIHELNHLCSLLGITVTICWIPSHIGITGNEIADKVAKQAASEESEIFDQIIPSDMKSAAKTKITDAWLQYARLKVNNDFYKHKVTRVPITNKRESTTITRLRIGHCIFTHEYLLKKTNRPHCERCQTPLTVKHIFERCPMTNNCRRKNRLPENTTEALQNKFIENVLAFVNELKLII